MKNLATEKSVGFLAMVITCVYTGISMPQQIFQIWKTQNAESLSLFMLVMMVATFSSWSVYALKKAKTDWYILVPNLAGSIGALVLVVLKLKYS